MYNSDCGSVMTNLFTTQRVTDEPILNMHAWPQNLLLGKSMKNLFINKIFGLPYNTVNPLNATGVYIRLIFTSRERERRIYTPAIYSGPYRANRRSLAAVRGKTLLI